MQGQHYDLALLGDAPGGRIAAILAARAGLRVLHLTGFGWPGELLWCSSELFENLLDSINGRSCLIPALPIQFRSDSLCVQLHGETTLADELHRELPDSAAVIQGAVRGLMDRGQQLQRLIADKRLVPGHHIGAWASWTLGCLGRGLSLKGGKSLVGNLKSALPDEPAKAFVADLLSCTCLREVAGMDLDTAALTCAQLFDPHQVAPAVLDGLLHRRLKDAGADCHNAFELRGLHWERKRYRLDFGSSRAYAATVALAGNPGWMIEGVMPPPLKNPRPAVWELTDFTGHISRILPPKILSVGSFAPVQVVIGRDETRLRIRLQTGFGPSETFELQSQLAPLFPFAEFTPVLQETALPLTGPTGALGLVGRVKLRSGLFVAAGHLLYPGLGMTGEALAAFHLLHHLNLVKKSTKST